MIAFVDRVQKQTRDRCGRTLGANQYEKTFAADEEENLTSCFQDHHCATAPPKK